VWRRYSGVQYAFGVVKNQRRRRMGRSRRIVVKTWVPGVLRAYVRVEFVYSNRNALSCILQLDIGFRMRGIDDVEDKPKPYSNVRGMKVTQQINHQYHFLLETYYFNCIKKKSIWKFPDLTFLFLCIHTFLGRRPIKIIFYKFSYRKEVDSCYRIAGSSRRGKIIRLITWIEFVYIRNVQKGFMFYALSELPVCRGLG
jgi:hypothetical protein